MNMGAKSALCKCKMEIFNKPRGHQVRPLYEWNELSNLSI